MDQTINPLDVRSEVVFRRTYSRQKADGTQETWAETVDRVIGHQRWLWERAQGGSLSKKQEAELSELRQLIFNKKVAPSGRVLWLGGTEVIKRRESAAFNCSFLNVETVYDVVDVLWLLLQGCGVGFRPIVGTLNGFRRPIPEIEVIRTKRTKKGGRETNKESFDPKTGTWTISVGDSAEAWAKSIGKLLAGKYPAKKLVLDFSQIRPAGERLVGYGWISSGDEQIAKAYVKISEILNRRAGQLLTRMDILDVINWLGTVLSSRRSAEIALFEYNEPEWREFALAKKDWWVHGNEQRVQSNNSLVFREKPSREELADIFQMMVDAGGSEPGFVNAQTALQRAPFWKGVNPCLHPDSIVETVDGRIKIKDIKQPTMVYTMLEDGSLGIRRCSAAYKTKTDAPILKITTRMGHTIRVTPDHKVFTQNRGWVEAQDLKVGSDILVHLARSRRGTKYSGVYLTSDKRRAKDAKTMEHRLVWEGYYGHHLPADWDVHHIDGDTYNNSIDNFEALPHNEHSTLTRYSVQNDHMVTGYNEKLGRVGFVSTGKRKPKTVIPMPDELKSLPANQYSGLVESIEYDGVSDVYDLTVEETHNFIADFTVVHNCCEILLNNRGFCNLVEINLSKFRGDTAGLLRATYLAGRMNYRQTCVDLRDGILQEAWHLNNDFLRLCGVGITGIATRNDLTAYDYRQIERTATAAAYGMADELGTPYPKNVTTVKPSGTLSKLMGTTEGVHKPLGKYIFNNINFSKHDPLVPKLIEAGYRHFDNPTDATGVIVTFPIAWENVEFTRVEKDGRVLEVNTESAIEQLERYKLIQNNYTQQNTSVTISYSPEEVPDIIDWIRENWDSYVGVSFIFRADPTKSAKDLGYLYLPQEVVTKEEFDEYVTQLKPVQFDDTDADLEIESQECAGGHCPVK